MVWSCNEDGKGGLAKIWEEQTTKCAACDEAVPDDNITVPFPTAREADIAYKVLKVDAEPKRSQASKDMNSQRQYIVSDNAETMHHLAGTKQSDISDQSAVSANRSRGSGNFSAPEVRQLRVAINSFLDLLILTTETMEIAYKVLKVDAEPKRSQASKDMKVKDNTLLVNFSAPEVRQLRVAINSFLDLLILTTETMEQFGPPVSEAYSHY
ncbi:unnamed protein product, partial [Timema podura]|nr:unnamed protein product [Timema podura]